MAYQIYRIGEWERVGGVDGYSTIRAYLEPGLYETRAFAQKKATLLAEEDYESGGDGSFEVVAVGESAFDNKRPSLVVWRAIHPHVLDPANCYSEETAMTRRTEDVPRPPGAGGRATDAKRRDIDTRPRPSKSPRIAAIRAEGSQPHPRPPARLSLRRRHRQPKPRKTPMRNRATLSPMNLTATKPMTLAEFLAWEERQELRYEFDGSEPVAMAGGSLAHAAIQRNLALALGSRLRGKPCQFFGSDLKIQAAENSSRYPDGMVICSGLDPTLKIVRNPVVIFEVLSPSTAAADRIVKAREYQATPSVQRYVMLEQERVGATVLVRSQDGWSALILKDDDTLEMPEIGLAIPLAEFYEGLTFEDHPVEDNDNEQTPPAA
jgi:Uma2 family endonuclease